ncbi:MAG TPA: hypothetical protein VHC22_24435 [Pirellulales bacterium]|nr:hypothetical protein [Pirellulales bacterium]
MGWHVAAFELLARWTAQSAAVLALTTLAVVCMRQPVRRIRLIQGAILICLALPCLSLVGWPADMTWHLPARARLQEMPPKTAHEDARPSQPDESLAHVSPPAASAPDTSRPNDQSEQVVRSAANDATRNQGTAQIGGARLNQPRPSWLQVVAGADLKWSCIIGYLAGVTWMVGWWCAGIAALGRLLRRSRPADARCRFMWRAVTAARAAGVRLFVSPAVEQPFVSGWRRPIVVLPENLARGDETDLRWALAHEWRYRH